MKQDVRSILDDPRYRASTGTDSDIVAKRVLGMTGLQAAAGENVPGMMATSAVARSAENPPARRQPAVRTVSVG